MKVSMLLLVALFFCWWSSATHANETKDNLALDYKTLTFTIDEDTTVDTYSKFMDEFRNEVQSGGKSYGIPLLRQKSKVPSGKEYLLLELTYNDDTVTLAVDVVNLNLVAYKAGTTSYFFKNYYQNLKDALFGNAKRQVQIPFNVRYRELGGRDDVALGISSLGDAVKVLREYNSKQMKRIKESTVVVNQMIIEAARFSLIEQQVITDFDQGFVPVDDIFSYEDNWGELSKAIQNSNEGIFDEPIELLTPDGSPKKITSVKQVKNNIALLLNAKKGGAVGDQEKRLSGLCRKSLDCAI